MAQDEQMYLEVTLLREPEIISCNFVVHPCAEQSRQTRLNFLRQLRNDQASLQRAVSGSPLSELR